MLKISTAIRNKIPTSNLIFRDENNVGVNLIYFPEIPNSGIEFINLYRKKNYWDYLIVVPAFTFLGYKILTNNYYKEIRTKIPQLRTQRKFMKVNKEQHSVVVDMTPLSETFAGFTKSRSKRQTIEAFFGLIDQIGIDNDLNTKKELYLVIDSNNTEEKSLTEAIFYMSKLNGNKFRDHRIEGILAYGNNRFWPLTISDTDKDGKFFKVNINIMTRFFKEVHALDIEEAPINKEKEIQRTKEEVQVLYKMHQVSEKRATSAISADLKKKGSEELEENPLETIRHIVNSNPFIKGNTFKEKLENLYKEPEAKSIKDEKQEIKPMSKGTINTIEKIDSDIRALNKKYNGVMTINERTISDNTETYFKPLDVIGFNEFHAYDRQSTEFDDTLDEAMVDLIKSLESDKDLNIKILSIKPVITDTYRDRFKTFKIKVQHKEFGHTKPYQVEFHIPYPSQGKYLKLGGNNFIATNQFFPKPVLKVKPNMVRVYTHYSTCAITLKRHIISDHNGLEKLSDDFSNRLKATKKLFEPSEKIKAEDAKYLIDKYNLPENIDPSLFINLKIKHEEA